MRAFEFFAAKDASDAVALLAKHGPKVKVIAGGTDLLAERLSGCKAFARNTKPCA